MIADSDNGYGNAINVVRTVREYIQTGVAAIHLEDQILPKRCGHVAGRRVVAIDEISAECGYADVSFFRRLFKRLTGLTPGQYRRLFQRA